MTAQLDADVILISRVREGDMDAFSQLYTRHVGSARRLARVLCANRPDAEDLVAEAFTRVLAGLRGGGGPEQAFRAYLLTTVRHVRYDRARRDKRVESTDNISSYERPESGEPDPTIAALERSYAARAFSKLPERWRTVLWHTEVEGESPAQIAPLLGLTANAVAALAYRARERLRQGYLAEHITITGSPRCHWTGEHLPGYVRAALANRERAKVDDHLAECSECRRLHRELTDANVGLRTVLAPLLLGAAAPGYLATTSCKAALLAWFAGTGAAVLGYARTGWWWLSTTPTRLSRHYGVGNVAAAAGLLLAAFIGVTLFAATVLVHPGGPLYQARAPRPAPIEPDTPLPVEAPQHQPNQPALGSSPSASAPPARAVQAAPPVPSPAAPAPASAPALAPVALSPALPTGGLMAGSTGTLPITVGGRDENTRTAKAGASSTRAWTLRLDLPAGVTLAGPDAGDGWRCRALPHGATCARPRLARASTAEVPVRIGPAVTGYQEIFATVDTVTRRLRVPVAPGGMRVGFAATGRLGVAMAGNTLVSCADRPTCLRTDNNSLSMVPALPAAGEPQPPTGLPLDAPSASPDGRAAATAGAQATSGARLTLPTGATVRWAGLTIVTSGNTAPDLVGLHGPSGDWMSREMKVTKVRSPRISTQSFAEVTDLLRDGRTGTWWVAAHAGQLPRGTAAYAGWALTVVYEQPSAPMTEIAIHLGQVALHGDKPLTVRVPADRHTTVGFAIFDGDGTLGGDTLLLGRTPVGDPANLASGSTASARALACPEETGECAWRTPGLDIGTYHGTVDGTGEITIRAGDDPLVLGLLAIATDVGTATTAAAGIR